MLSLPASSQLWPSLSVFFFLIKYYIYSRCAHCAAYCPLIVTGLMRCCPGASLAGRTPALELYNQQLELNMGEGTIEIVICLFHFTDLESGPRKAMGLCSGTASFSPAVLQWLPVLPAKILARLGSCYKVFPPPSSLFLPSLELPSFLTLFQGSWRRVGRKSCPQEHVLYGASSK